MNERMLRSIPKNMGLMFSQALCSTLFFNNTANAADRFILKRRRQLFHTSIVFLLVRAFLISFVFRQNKMILSGIQILAKQKALNRPSMDNLWPNVLPKYVAGSLIEVSSALQDKSLLLQQIMALAILPLEFGGKNSEVLFVDLQHDFDVLKFTQQQLHSKITPTTTTAAMDKDKLELTVRQCLEAVTHITCFSSLQFELCLLDLETMIIEKSNVSLIIIDGLESFYWEDCHEQLQKMATHYKKLCQRLKSLASRHNICCIFSVDEYYRKTKLQNYSCAAADQLDYRINIKQEKNANGDVIGRWLNDVPFTIENTGIKF